MNEFQKAWAQACERLKAAAVSQGFTEEVASLMARQLGSPKAMDRMTSYIRQVHPRSEEMLVDEMLAICAEIDEWRRKKAGREAQASYTALRRFGGLGETGQEDES